MEMQIVEHDLSYWIEKLFFERAVMNADTTGSAGPP